MKNFVKLSIVIFSLFLLSGILIAQKSQFGFGNSESNSKPEIAQGSSAAINFELKPVLFKGNPITDQYMVSYESEKNELMVQECDISPQAILPLGNSINVKSGEKTGFGIANPGIESAIFSYSALFEQRTGSYAWYINYNWTNFQTRLTNLGSQGFRIENIDTYGHNIFDYGGTWTTDGQGWAWILNYSNVADFISILNNWPLGLNRYRPIDFAIHPYLNSAQYYGAVAVEDNLGFSWAINYDQSPFKTWIANQWNSSRRLVELEMYQDPSSGNLKYAAISEDGTYAQTYWINLNWNTFISNHNSILTGGGRLVDYDTYSIGEVVYYAGLWNYDGVGSGYVLNFGNQATFTTNVNSQINLGRLPIMVDVYDSEELINSISKRDLMLPANTSELGQNYPNPFNPSTKIKFTLSKPENVRIEIYNTIGQKVEILFNQPMNAGHHEVEFNAKSLSSGIYFYQIEAGEFQDMKKMLLIK